MYTCFFSLFFVDPADHCIAYGDFCFDVISHTYNEDLFSDIIPNIFQECKDNFWSNFTEGSNEYFEEHLEEFMSEGVFSIPYLDENISGTEPFLNDQIISIMNTMKDWCCKNECEEILKGFVIYGYNLDSHLKLLKFPENVLQDHVYETSYDSHEMVIVYNAVIQVILLIRIAQGECLENVVKLSTNDMIKFVLAFHDVLDKSGAKLINLVVTEEGVNYQSKCESCKQQIISIKIFSSSEVYQRWWMKKKQNFGISVIHMNLNKKFSFALSAKALGFVTFFQLSSENQSQGTFPCKTIYMTPDKTKILYSPPKHIDGCPGLGKSVVPSKKTEILISRLQPNKSLHDKVCDSRQKLGEEIQLNPKLGICMVMTKPEITTIEQLLTEDTDQSKLNLIFDEFDSEVLKEFLAKKLNNIFKTNKKLKNSNIIVIHQRFQEDKEEGKNKRKGNYEMFETFRESDKLICNMIDTTENKLVQVAETQFDKTEKQVRKEDIQSNSTKGKFFIEDTEKYEVENRSKSEEEEYPFDFKKFQYNANEQSVPDTSQSGSIFIGSSKVAAPLKGKIGRTKAR